MLPMHTVRRRAPPTHTLQPRRPLQILWKAQRAGLQEIPYCRRFRGAGMVLGQWLGEGLGPTGPWDPAQPPTAPHAGQYSGRECAFACSFHVPVTPQERLQTRGRLSSSKGLGRGEVGREGRGLRLSMKASLKNLTPASSSLSSPFGIYLPAA